jgi:hypothetical protein
VSDISKKTVADMADKLEPVEGTDHLGNHYRFQIFHWLGNLGLCDEHGKKVLIPATSTHKKLYVNFSYEAIIAGNHLQGWEVFSLDCTRLWPGHIPFRSLTILMHKLRGRSKTWRNKKS